MNRCLVVLLLCLCMFSCERQHETYDDGIKLNNTELIFSSDTIHDGGLCLLHNIKFKDINGIILFEDSINDYEPDTIVVKFIENKKGYIVFRLFDPCDDTQRLLILTDGNNIINHIFLSTDTIQELEFLKYVVER